MQLGQSRTRNLNFSLCLSFYTTPAENNLFEKEAKERERYSVGEYEGNREREKEGKGVSKLLLVNKILY